MNFTDLTNEISVEFDIPRYKTRRMLLTILRKMRKRLIFGDDIKLKNIGTLKSRVRKPKKYLHLKTGNMEMSKRCLYLDFKATPSIEKAFKEKPVY